MSIHLFENQSKEEVANILKGSCEMKDLAKNEFIEDLKIAETKVEVQPEIYLFENQSKDAVEKIFKIYNKHCVNTTSDKEPVLTYPEGTIPCEVSFDRCAKTAEAVEKENNAMLKDWLRLSRDVKPEADECWGKNYESRLSPVNSETTATWLKLSGLKTEVNFVENSKKLPKIMEEIISACKKFNSSLSFEWSDEAFDSCLLVNEARTKINYNNLASAFEGLQKIVAEDEAVKLMAEIVVKKLEALFV